MTSLVAEGFGDEWLDYGGRWGRADWLGIIGAVEALEARVPSGAVHEARMHSAFDGVGGLPVNEGLRETKFHCNGSLGEAVLIATTLPAFHGKRGVPSGADMWMKLWIVYGKVDYSIEISPLFPL